MGSRRRAGVRALTAELETVLLTDDSRLPEIEDIAENTHESLWSSRVAADRDIAATNANDAVEWLTRVLRCALDGEAGHGPGS
jgi:hypothetical protein